MKKEDKIKELERRIKELENRPIVYPVVYPTQQPFIYQYPPTPPLHYHNGSPCWNNPCVWC